MEYDVFISHASEDKNFVHPFAERLKEAGVTVWYDQFELGWGKSVTTSIDTGIAKCKFGIVVLSAHYFEKAWPIHELSGLRQRQLNTQGEVFLLPLYCGIDNSAVRDQSPTLADIYALPTSVGIETIVSQVLAILGRSSDAISTLAGKILAPTSCRYPRVVIDGEGEGKFFHFNPWWVEETDVEGTQVFCAPYPFAVTGLSKEVIELAKTEKKVLLLRSLGQYWRRDKSGLFRFYQYEALTEPDREDSHCFREQ